jgi:deoxycytidine triphosphate deaminase
MYMILKDVDLLPWAERNIHPFDKSCINPASIDLRLDDAWRDIDEPDKIVNSTYIDIYPRTLRVDIYNRLAKWRKWPRKPTAILASTLETVIIHPDKAASIKLKTTPTREGLGHPIADWVDPGFVGQLTLMLYANKAIRLEKGSRIVQLVVFQLDGPVGKDYGETGHYFGQWGPTPSWRMSNDNS